MFIYAILILLPALALAADPLTQLENALFTALDADKDGKIEKPEAEKYFLSYDANKDGEITLAEFKASVDKLDPQFVGHEAALYALFDRDGNKQVNKADIDAVFVLADTNKDNKIEKPEFSVVFAAVVTHVG